jgi:hypothetical protein
MTARKIVYLDKDNTVIFPFIYNDENQAEARLLAAIDSDHKYIEIDSDIQADFGWNFDGENLIDTSGNTIELTKDFAKNINRKLICVVEGDVAAYIQYPASNSKLLNLAEALQNNPTHVEVDPSIDVQIGWKYDGSKFYNSEGIS